MFLLNMSFFDSPWALTVVPTAQQSINKILVQNGIWDRIRADAGSDVGVSQEIPNEWDSNTRLDAKFQGDLNAGNTDYSLETVDLIRIKRKAPNNSWLTLYECPIEELGDFNFDLKDLWAPASDSCEYASVPVYKGNEGSFIGEYVDSSLVGLFISDSSRIEGTQYNIDIGNRKKNDKTSVINTLANKYPFVIGNSENNYYTIPIEAFFYDQNLTHKGNVLRRDDIMEWLHNGTPKVFRFDDGRIWLAKVTSAPQIGSQGHLEIEPISFEITEIGDALNGNDMVDNGILKRTEV